MIETKGKRFKYTKENHMKTEKLNFLALAWKLEWNWQSV